MKGKSNYEELLYAIKELDESKDRIFIIQLLVIVRNHKKKIR